MKDRFVLFLRSIGLIGLIGLLGILPAAAASPAEGRAAHIRAAVERLLTIYPRSTVADIYKSCFQDRYGPGHLTIDTVAARRYFDAEIATTTAFGGPLFEPTAPDGRFYRVNLALVADGIVTADDFFAAFLRSAAAAGEPIPIEQWRGEWMEILEVVDELPLDQSESERQADCQAITLLLDSGRYQADHSERYATETQFHYRILTPEEFRCLLLNP